jgi:hypothetical protein
VWGGGMAKREGAWPSALTRLFAHLRLRARFVAALGRQDRVLVLSPWALEIGARVWVGFGVWFRVGVGVGVGVVGFGLGCEA